MPFNVALLYCGEGLARGEIAKREVIRAMIANRPREVRDPGIVDIGFGWAKSVRFDAVASVAREVRAGRCPCRAGRSRWSEAQPQSNACPFGAVADAMHGSLT
ncbi:MAG: hypothetical protein OXE85_11215 [Roseovarius sp.]|nr:hypothetical protein [Roseovarius sp.]